MKISRLLQSKQTVFPAAFPAAAFSMPPRAYAVEARLRGWGASVVTRSASRARAAAPLSLFFFCQNFFFFLNRPRSTRTTARDTKVPPA